MIHLLGRDHVNVRVHAAGGSNEVLAGDDLGTGAHDQIRVYAVHNTRVARLAHAHDVPVTDTDVGFDDAQYRVHDDRVGNHQVEGAVAVGY